MEVRCIKVKIKKGSLKHVKDWFFALTNRKSEVIETLKNENIIVESAFLDTMGEESYLIYYIRSPDIKKALEIFRNSCLPVDNFYKKNWNACCEDIKILDVLLDVDISAIQRF